MLTLPSSLRVYAAVEPVDLRKGFDALSILARTVLGKDPLGNAAAPRPFPLVLLRIPRCE